MEFRNLRMSSLRKVEILKISFYPDPKGRLIFNDFSL